MQKPTCVYILHVGLSHQVKIEYNSQLIQERVHYPLLWNWILVLILVG
jgi:hypothetical protein